MSLISPLPGESCECLSKGACELDAVENSLGRISAPSPLYLQSTRAGANLKFQKALKIGGSESLLQLGFAPRMGETLFETHITLQTFRDSLPVWREDLQRG